MDTQPAGSPTDVVLRDGSTVTLRPVRPDDVSDLRRLADDLAPGTLYTRFFAVPRAPDVEIDAIVGADDDRLLVTVAEWAGRLVGLASFCRDAQDRTRAEVTLSVARAFQGRGLGTRLLETIARLAYAREVRTFDAYVLADNERMMQVFTDSGFPFTHASEAGVYHVVLSLGPSPAQEAQAAARAQTAAAASMRAFFEPSGVVVIGANRERGKIGSEVLHNIRSEYKGRLYVVHPSAAAIQGVPAFRSVGDIPDALDLAVVTVPAAIVGDVVDACIAKGVRALVVISAGFGETGVEGRARELELVERVRRAGVRMVGPNCMGIINADPAVRLNATFSPVAAPPGHVAMSTQSGALGLAILDYARRLHIGFSTFVSVGNKADVSANDLVQYWAEDPNTHVIVLYLESFGNPRKFSQIARRVGRLKPIVAVKAGRSAVGARAASSHTGALASSDAIVDALFRQSGVIRTTTIEELFDVAMLLANQPVPRGRRVAILTNAGGPGILAADACEAQGLDLPPLADRTIAELRAFLPPAASLANPVDMLASAPAEHYERGLAAVLADPSIDSILVIFIPPMVTSGVDVARAIHRATSLLPDKPVLAVFMSADPAPALLGPVPSFTFPEAAAVALGRATAYGEWRARPEGQVPMLERVQAGAIREIAMRVLARGGGWASPDEAQALIAAAGIAAAAGQLASTEDDAVAAAERLGYPVVLKAAGPAIVHKTELDAVRVGLVDAADVRRVWRDFDRRLHDQMTGVLVQQVVPGGVEMLAGIVQDPTFGPVIACASGGKLTEVLADSQFRLHPLTDLDARAMIEGLRSSKLLRGYRGAKPSDESALADALLRLSLLAGLCPELQELDINPLVVLETGVCALDVRARLEPPRAAPRSRRVSY
jgi:acetyl coenzyme A synthetase (ADP forming)-like protein